jgi:hypothetical protein
VSGCAFRPPAIVVLVTLAGLFCGCGPPPGDRDWERVLGYSAGEIHAIEIGDFGYPYVPVEIGDDTVTLAFDTGNMVGVSVNEELFDRLGLATVETWDRVTSAGEPIATLRIGQSRRVSALGRDLGPVPIYELDDARLPGLLGPRFLTGGRFTLDYVSRRIAVSDAALPDTLPGFRALPLVRSERHPALVLVRGTVEGRGVLMQLDTGKSRTVVNPTLAAELGLERGERGVRIARLGIGDLSFEVPSAKEVDQSALDPELAEPILAGIGSDILSRFVWTVDYRSGTLWMPDSP